MESHRELTDLEFEKGFNERSIDPKIFNHEAHLRLAWIHISKYGTDTAKMNLCNQIQAFDQTFGDGKKFKKDLTVACVEVLEPFILKSKTSDFNTFMVEFPELKSDFLDLVKKHMN